MPVPLPFKEALKNVCSVLPGLGIFGIAGWLPPVRADMDALSLAGMFQRDRLRIQLGMTVMGSSAMFYWFFAAAVSTQLQRIEGEFHPLTRIQMIAASGTGSHCYLCPAAISPFSTPDRSPGTRARTVAGGLRILSMGSGDVVGHGARDPAGVIRRKVPQLFAC